MSASANRYAKALFDVALQEKADLAQIDRDLTLLSEVMHEHRTLLQEATRHGVPDEVRTGVMGAISDKLGAGSQVRKLLLLLARSHKLALVPDMTKAYRERLHAHQNVVSAHVATAAPLAADKTQALAARLSEVTGKTVDLTVSVDDSLIGGIVATIGSTVYDGSVKTQLKKLREALTQ